MRLIVVLIMMLVAPLGFSTTAVDREAIENRIKPVGEVHLKLKADSDSNFEQTLADTVSRSKSAGQDTYERYCVVCHAQGLAGAPKFRNKEDWAPRLKKKTIDELLATALKGINAMPVKGTCMSCSDEELKNAINYMLPKS